MTAVKWPRVSGGKCIEKWEIDTDSGPIQCRTYMVKGDELTSWECAALLSDGEFATMSAKGRYSEGGPERLDDLERRFRKHIKERVSIDWQPHLYVEVTSSYLADPGLKARPLFPANETLRNSRTLDMSLDIHVARVELGTTGSGDKKHRGGLHGGSANPRNGWPEVGAKGRSHYGNAGSKMLALIEDTPANREAVEAIRQGMRRLNAQLRTALSPEHIEQAFANVHRLLPAGEEG